MLGGAANPARARWAASVFTALVVALAGWIAAQYRQRAQLERQWRSLEGRLTPLPDSLEVLARIAELPEPARERSPQIADALANLAPRLVRSGKTREAEAILRQAVELAPRSGYPRYAYSVLLTHLGRHDAALAELDRARALSPRDPRIALQTGIVQLELHRRAAAEASFRRALALDPALSDAYLGLAYVNNSPARYPRAVAAIRRFNQLRPRAGEGQIMLARLRLDLRQYPQAIAAARAAIAARPADSACWHLLGLATAADPGTAGAAEPAFRRAIDLNPGFPGSHYELGRLCLKKGDAAGAVTELRRALELWPGNGDYHWTLMRALRQAGDEAGATSERRLAQHYTRYRAEQERLSQRIQHHPREVRYYEELARLHLSYGAAERAAHVLRDAIAVAPDNPGLREQLRRAGQAAAPASVTEIPAAAAPGGDEGNGPPRPAQ
jgi:tetratricopeptide (TPR) repeat protein